MKKRNLYIVVFVVSIFGLAVVQYQYLRIGLNLAKVQFDRKIEQTGEDIRRDLISRNQLTFLIGRFLEKDEEFFTVGLDSIERASHEFLNAFIAERLTQNGVDIDFDYDLHTRDTIYYLNSPSTHITRKNLVVYPIELAGYLPELISKRLVLELKFEPLNGYFLSKLNGLTLPSLLFILGIVATIIWVLKTYYWQRNVIATTNDFINNLTHELKTPVFSISLATKILDQQASAEQKSLIVIIRQQVVRLTEHIDKVLEIGSMEGKKRMFKLIKVDFKPYLQKLCEEFSLLTSMEEIVFTYVFEKGTFDIMAEVFHLENAVNNLLDNAKKYSENPVIHLEAVTKNKQLEIRVRDNGRGIDKKDRHRIFQKYYRATNGDLHDVKGYGLGLSYVKKVVENLKGTVTIESEKNKGTLVMISIPLYTGGKKT